MFSNGHVTVTSCLFQQFDPSGLMSLPKKMFTLCLEGGKVLTHSLESNFILLFSHSKWSVMRKTVKDHICKVFPILYRFPIFWKQV